MNILRRLFALALLAYVALPAIIVSTQYGAVYGLLTACTAAQSLTVSSSLGVLNGAAGLKFDKVMRNSLRALKRRLSPVLALSHVFRNEVLTETDTIKVPYYPLATLASKDFDQDDGYVFEDDAANSMLQVTVNKRKYQELSFTSKELRRNSVLDLELVMALKVEKLADDVLKDIFSVVKAADYGASILELTAAQFDRTDVSALRTALTKLDWPTAGRALVLETEYEGALVTDQLNVSTSGTDAALRNGSVGRMLNFDIFDHPNMPENGERLVGAAMLPYAILAAFSPIEAAEEIPTIYRAYTDPESQLTLEYRAWGDPFKDKAHQVIEVNYGYRKGDTAQLKRITKPAP